MTNINTASGAEEQPEERAVFEAWALNAWFPIRRLPNSEAGRDYGIDSAQDAWEAWQARAALASAAAPAEQPNTACAALPAECDSPELCAVSRSCAGQFGTKRICASRGQAPAQAAPAAVAGPKPGERCQHCIDLRDGFYGSYAPPCPYHDDDGKPRVAAPTTQTAPQQEAQEPVAVPRFNCWTTNDGDSWFDHPADSQAIYDCLGNDAKVGDEYELTAGWRSVTARYRITEVVGDGEEYEVECISHQQENTALAARAPADSVLEDAARYRHLRDCNSGSLAVMQITGTGEDDWCILTEDAADAAIDAARKQGANHD